MEDAGVGFWARVRLSRPTSQAVMLIVTCLFGCTGSSIAMPRDATGASAFRTALPRPARSRFLHANAYISTEPQAMSFVAAKNYAPSCNVEKDANSANQRWFLISQRLLQTFALHVLCISDGIHCNIHFESGHGMHSKEKLTSNMTFGCLQKSLRM